MVDLPDKVETSLPSSFEKDKTESIQEKKEEPQKTQETLPEKVPVEKKVDPQTVSLHKQKKKESEIEKLKQKQKQALNKLKTKSALEKIKDELKNEKPKSNHQFKGRALSPGMALTGLDKLQSESYLSQLDVAIKSNWALPEWLMNRNLRTRVQIKFNSSGELIYKKITESSGNQTYDDYCLQAIQNSSPFPHVPEKFSLIYQVSGVIIGFPD